MNESQFAYKKREKMNGEREKDRDRGKLQAGVVQNQLWWASLMAVAEIVCPLSHRHRFEPFCSLKHHRTRGPNLSVRN